MVEPPESSGRRHDRTIAALAGVSIAMLGGSVLAGWQLHLERLKTIIAGSIPIPPNLAAGLLLCGLALVLLSRRNPARPVRICAVVIAAAVTAAAALTLTEYFFGSNLPIDQWLFGGHPGVLATLHPGRMSPASAFCLILVGSALFAASKAEPTRFRLSVWGGLGATLVVIGAITLASFFLEVLFGSRWNFMGMSIVGIPGAAAFLCLGIGLLALLHSEGGLNWSLDRMTTAGFALGFLLITLATAFSYDFTLKLHQAAGQVAHTQEFLRALEEIEADVSELERAQGGYIITGDERLVEEWDVKESAIRAEVEKLQQLAADASHQSPLLRQFITLLWQRTGWARETIEARRKQGFSAAQDMIASGTGTRFLAESDRLVRQVEDGEYARLHERQTRSVVASQTTFLMLPLAVFLCFAILSLGLFFLNSAMGERRRAEGSLRQSEERMRAVLDSALDCIITMDHDGRIMEFNPAAEKTFGYQRGEAIGQLLSELIIPPSLRKAHQKGLARYLVTGNAAVLGKRLELAAVRRDGSEFPVELAITRIGSRQPPMFTGFIRDITESNRAAEELRSAHQQLRGVLAHSPAVIYSLKIEDQKAHPTVVSENIERLLGVRMEDATHEWWLANLHPDDRERVLRTLSESLSGAGYSSEYRMRHKDGSYHWIEDNNRIVRDASGKATESVGVWTDITERKLSDETIRVSEQRFSMFMDNVPGFAWMKDVEGRYVYGNKLFHQLRPQEQTWPGMTAGEIWPPEIAGPLRANDEKVIETKAPLQIVEMIVQSGEKRTVLSSKFPIFGEDGEVDFVCGIGIDITERKRVEEHMLEQADIINRARDAIIIRNFEDRRIIFWNSGAERLYGWTAAEVMGEAGEAIFSDPKEVEKIMAGLLSADEFRGEVKQITKEGKELITEGRATLVRNPDGSPRSVLIICTDVTEQKKLEMHLLRAQRLESIGTLASGVAHDLNNILTPILICAEVLRGNPAAEDIAPTISLIEDSARRGAAVVKQVLTFARGVEGERVTIKPGHLIEEMLDIARKTFPKSIEITSRYPEDLATIDCDPTQLHQVLLNLSLNARDAMPNGGRLSITAENFEVDEHFAAMTPGATTGPHVMLCVSDTGTGMPKASIDMIFDPFFTTKEAGKGTGLGLSTALGIIKSHGGFISVYTELGSGTGFKIFLPASANSETLPKSKVLAELLEGKGELILLVDDEPGILDANKMILEKHNYRVLTATDGTEALALIAQQKGAIRIVLTDISMPYMDGVMLIRAIKKMQPDTTIIASTGQSEQGRVAELRALNVNNFLSKPYNAETLFLGIRNALEGRADVSALTARETIGQLASIHSAQIGPAHADQPAHSL